MRAGEFPDGARVLRAKIDMAAPNINLRDPVLYRILHAEHPRTGDAWCVYPTYDFAHGQSDAIEGITHSICTLEFEDHRPLYDWLIENLPVPSRPRQIRVRAAQPHPHRALQARAAAPRQRGASCAAGTTRACPPCRACAAAASPPRASATSRRMVGVAKADSVVEVEHARARRARRPQPDGAPPLRRPRPPQGRHRELPRGPGRGDGGPQQPGGPVRRQRARCPSRGSCGSSATTSWRSRCASSSAWLPAARCGCGRVLRDLHRGRQGRRRQDRGAALHLRPGDARRRRARRPPPQGDAPLGVGRARRAGRGPALRLPLHEPVPRGRRRATSSRT